MEYEPVFKIAYANILVTDLFIRSYVDSNPLVTIKNKKWEFFLPKEILKKCSEQGYEFALNEDKYKEFKKKYFIFTKKFEKIKKINIEKLSKEEFLNFLNEFKELTVGFRNTYRETEFFYFTKIEKQLNEYIQDKFSFQDLLSNKVKITSWPEAMRKLADYIINMQHLKFEYRKLINTVILGENSLFSELLKQLIIKTNRKDSTSMTFEEIKKVLNGEKIKDVSERSIYSYVTWDKEKQKLNIISGGDAYTKIRELNKDIPKNEVIGQSTCKGIVKGKAKVITHLSPKQMKSLLEMKKGYILICDTTMPEIMPVIGKAVAIVTDEGGMMSHAAIISREFNIPCVVGTKYATKIFKDGDLIEVNANNGFIKKI